MMKKRLTPLLLATIITAGLATGGIATGFHFSSNLIPPQSYESSVDINSTSQKLNSAQSINDNHTNSMAATNDNKAPKQNANESVHSSISINKKSNNNDSNEISNNNESNKSSNISNNDLNNKFKSSNNTNTATIQKSKQIYSQTAGHKLTLPEGNILVNGTPVESQLQNDSSINNEALTITSGMTSDYQKAQALYVWVSKNISYNTKLENEVENGNKSYSSSAIKAFNLKQGICEDFSTLYCIMANDAGLAVRLIGGSGYGNSSWSNHAWNQVYIPSMGWINVDCTFANSYVALVNKYNLPFNEQGLLSQDSYYTYQTAQYSYKIYTEDYFNSSNFSDTHTNGKILAQLGVS